MRVQDIVFEADGAKLAGWLCRPDQGEGPFPAIVLSHGLSAVIDMGLKDYAEVFAAAGFLCLVYDHRNWGRSSGWPRHETDPWRQVADMREAISFLRRLPEVDPARIGLWGTSYSGGHALVVAALDRRVRCVVAQVPLVSGSRTFEHWVPADRRARFLDRLAKDWDARAAGTPPGVAPAAAPGSETEEWARQVDREGRYANEITLRTFDALRGYEPADFVARIAPTPLLMVVADGDTQTPVEWQREAFARAGEPKQLVTLAGRHYDPYTRLFAQSATAAADWFRLRL
jgi:fermentation-respiration switch protein FrsA (DUF1100 family)